MRWVQVWAAACAAAVTTVAAAQVTTSSYPGMDAAALARASESPLADVTVLTLQDDLQPEHGPAGGFRNVLNLQPVLPFAMGEAVLATRTVIPLVRQPGLAAGAGGTFGLGNVTFSALLGPARSSGVVWAVGATGLFPTATAPELGSRSTWGLGPSLLVLGQPGRWLLGALATNVWSVAGARWNELTVQYLVNYTFASGWFLTSSPVVRADWTAPRDDRWTVPIGGGLGKLLVVGGLPVKLSAQAFWNAVRPDDRAGHPSSPWEARISLGVLP
jgi:hypothetical protein